MALQADGWWLRSEIIWHKPNPMPESVTDRPTSAHEKMFLLSKSGSHSSQGRDSEKGCCAECADATNTGLRLPQPRYRS